MRVYTYKIVPFHPEEYETKKGRFFLTYLEDPGMNPTIQKVTS